LRDVDRFSRAEIEALAFDHEGRRKDRDTAGAWRHIGQPVAPLRICDGAERGRPSAAETESGDVVADVGLERHMRALRAGALQSDAPRNRRRRFIRRRRLRARVDHIEDCKANQKWREPDDSLHKPSPTLESRIEDENSRIEGRGYKIEGRKSRTKLAARSSIFHPRSSILASG